MLLNREYFGRRAGRGLDCGALHRVCFQKYCRGNNVALGRRYKWSSYVQRSKTLRSFDKLWTGGAQGERFESLSIK